MMEILPQIPFICVFDVCMCFLVCSGRWEIGCTSCNILEFSMSTLEKVKSLIMMSIYVNGDWCKCGHWKSKSWWCLLMIWTESSHSHPNQKTISWSWFICITSICSVAFVAVLEHKVGGSKSNFGTCNMQDPPCNFLFKQHDWLLLELLMGTHCWLCFRVMSCCSLWPMHYWVIHPSVYLL